MKNYIFQALVKGGHGISIQKGISGAGHVIEGLYSYVDYIFSRDLADSKIKCKKGCAYCCYQPVWIDNYFESLAISEFLLANERILEKFLQHYQAWDALYEPYRKLFANADQNTIIKLSRRIQIKCPFLHNNDCLIYGLRPISCRTYYSTQWSLFCKLTRGRSGHLLWNEDLQYSKEKVLRGLYQAIGVSYQKNYQILPHSVVFCNPKLRILI